MAAVFVLDRQGRVATWSLGAEGMYGHAAADVIGADGAKLHVDEDVAAGEPARLLLMADQAGSVELDGRRRRSDGSVFPARVAVTALRDASGAIASFAIVTTDLTGARGHTQEQQRSDERFHYLVDAVTDYAIFVLDAAGYVETWNAGARRTKGYEASEIVGQHFSVFYTPDDRRAGKPQHVLEVVRREGRYEEEGWRVRKDGTHFWASVVVTALRDADGTLTGFAKVTRDLTERRRAEEELRRSEERFRLLVEGVSDYAIYMLDAAGRVTTWNAGAERIKGYTQSEILGSYYGVFFGPEQRAAGAPERELKMAAERGRFEEEGWRVKKDGSQFWANAVLTALRNAKGELLGFAKVTRDLTLARAAEDTARELIREQTARATAEAAEYELRLERERYRALSHRLEAIFEGVADGIVVHDQAGTLVFANSAAANMCGFATVQELLGASSTEVLSRFEIVDEHGAPIPQRELPGRRVFAGEPSATALVRSRDRRSGRWSWSSLRASPVIGSDGKPELAVNIWHDVSEERRREEREAYLARASATLSSSLDYQVTLSTLADLLVPGLADWCAIHLLEEDRLRLVAAAHADPEKVASAREYERRYPLDMQQPRGIANVVRTGQPELYEDVSSELLAQHARGEEHLELLRATGMQSVLLVPIRVRDRVTGTLTLVSAQGGRRYDAYDSALAEEIGRRAGTSIDNAWLYAAEKRARSDLELVARAGEALSGTLDYEETLRTVARVSLPALADFAFFDVVEGSDVRRIAAAHDDPELDALVKQMPWSRSERRDKDLTALSSGELGLHPNIDDAWLEEVAAGAEHLALLRRLRLCSMVTVPLRARGQLLGSLTLCFGKSGRRHTVDDARLAEELARRSSVAVTQARLYEQAHAAALRAEEASRVKDEFLATVSHELRTPLNAILGWSSLLRDQDAKPSTVKGIDVIHRNAQAQAKIIDDILDVSRIITGKLRLELARADLVAIVRNAMEVVAPSAAAKRLTIELVRPSEECVLVADPDRLQQVVWNLLSNAVKFTDPTGKIVVTVGRESSKLVISVKDTGRGIDPAFLKSVFDPFKQADGSTTRRVGGLGLGLAIVRHIVELHGGEVHASSDGPGKGATFSIALPVRAVLPAGDESDQRASETPSRPSAAPAATLTGLRFVVVDDDPDARQLLETVIEQAGGTVATAASASEAFGLLAEHRPHVLVSDIGMPDEDGYSFMRRVRALDPASGGGIPSVALSAYTRNEDKAKALAAGFTTHIGKPVDPTDLLAVVANLARLAPMPRG